MTIYELLIAIQIFKDYFKFDKTPASRFYMFTFQKNGEKM